MKRSPSRRVVAALITPLVLLTASAAADASTPPGDSGPGSSTPAGSTTDVVVHDEGAADPRVNLNDVPVVVGVTLHSTKTNESAGEIHLSGSETLDATVQATTTVEQTAEVTEIAPDGGFTVVRTVDSYDFVVTAGPAELGGFLKDDEELEPLVGLPLVQVYDADRALLSVTPADPAVTLSAEQEEAIAEVIADGADAARLPDADLGVGATWTAFLQGSKGATAEFELLTLDAGEASITLAIDGDAASMLDAESSLENVSGTVTGTGTMTVDLTNSLASDTSLELNLDMSGSTQGFTFAMVLDSTMTNEVTVG